MSIHSSDPDQTTLPAEQTVPGSWADAFRAVLVFILIIWMDIGWRIVGAVNSILGLPAGFQRTLNNVTALFVLALLVVLLVWGWRKGFPSWSYPSLGMSALVVCIIVVSIPGLDVGGLGLLFAPLIILSFLILLVQSGRSWKPFAALYRQVHKDWTLFSLAYLSVAAMILSVTLDETHYEEIVEVILHIILGITVIVHIRSVHHWQRMLTLPFGCLVAWIVTAVYMSQVYDGRVTWLQSDTFRWLIIEGTMSLLPLILLSTIDAFRRRTGTGHKLLAA